MPIQAVKERPILFSAPMVRAILEGRKTQTRRICKPMQRWADQECRYVQQVNGRPHHFLHGAVAPYEELRSPYGQPGDRLWVRETWQVVRETIDYETGGESDIYDWPGTLDEARQHLNGDARFSMKSGLYYAADGDGVNPCNFYDCIGINGEVLAEREMRWRPSIHMPRWASRILLEVVSVRVERLQDISCEDARAEGLLDLHAKTLRSDDNCWHWSALSGMGYAKAERAYRALWESINGPASWEANPWVWVVEFKRVEA